MTTTELTGRPAEVKQRLQRGMAPKDIADDLGITRNAVYQHIGRLKREGVIPDDAPRPRATRARRASQAGVLDAAERFINEQRARLDAIEAQEAELRAERAQIVTVLDAIEGSLKPNQN
jgi:predicted transcriptional regulator